MIRGSRLWAGPCDIILAEGHWVPTLVRAASLPMVGILHGLDPMTLSGARNDPVRKAIIARSLRRMDELVAVGIPVLHGLPPDLRHRTTVITNGVQLDQYPRRHVSAAQRTMADDFPRFVTVGHVIPDKNHEVLLREFPKVREIWPRAQWTIIGDGTQRRRLERLRDDLGLHDAIRFVGPQSPTEVAATLAGSDLFVLPTLREAFGCVFLEAMAVGVPTLIPRSAGASFLVNDERYLHDPTDAGEIIRKARAILATPAAYEHAVEHGLRIAERSTWSEHAERLLKVLESSISRRRERTVAA
jgi:glycosyltransferase involved in cell wall biosynthesis